MNIILNGVITGSNFGDYMFADIFYKRISDVNKDGYTLFYESSLVKVSDFYKKWLNYDEILTKKKLRQADMLVYFSGGYFGEKKKMFIRSLKLYLKYFHIANYFILRNKSIVFIGIGGGSTKSSWYKAVLKRILSYKGSRLIVVRDNETKQYFESWGITHDVIVTTDTAHVVSRDLLPPLNEHAQRCLSISNAGEKVMLLHIISTADYIEMMQKVILPVLNNFFQSHQDYCVVFIADQPTDYSIIEMAYETLATNKKSIYEYDDPWQLCALIEKCDLMITPKLHAGIYAAIFSKSVISLANHYEKTSRYYRQIGEPGRCVPLTELTDNQFNDMLDRYADYPIDLPQELADKANSNLNMLIEIIKGFKN